MKKIITFFEKIVGVHHWHPKIALRYLPIVKAIHTRLKHPYSVLDVGSNGLGIAPYLKEKVIGLDLSFDQPIAENLTAVCGSAEHIPFSDRSFEAVVCMDTLEHIPPKARDKVLFELIRVTTRLLCIGVPTDTLSHEQDKELFDLYRRKKGKDFPYLIEHIKYGLPDSEALKQTMIEISKKLNRKISIEMIGNISLPMRLFLMKGWMHEGILANIFFRKILLLFIPFLSQFNKPPVYRTLFIVTIVG